MEPSIGGDAGGAAAGLIKDSTTATFVQDVVEASRERPILVDFWAPWCGPCKQLTPIIEKVVKAADGAVALVKVDIDENPQIAQQLQVQSIPAVFVFKDGQPVDGFVGAQPESQVKAMIERVAGPIGPSPVDQMLAAAAAAFQAGDVGGAAQAYGQILQHDAANPGAIGGLAKCNIAGGELEQAKQVLGLAGPDVENHPEIAAAKAALDLAEKSEDLGDVTELSARVEASPADHQARFDLAVALGAAGDKEQAVEHLLEIIRRDRNWNDEAARKQLLTFFELFGPTDPVTQAARRSLSSLLFS